MEPFKKNKTQSSKKKKSLGLFSSFGFGEEREYFVDNLSILLHSGMGILPALKALRLETRSRRFARLIEQMEDQIESGIPVWSAMAEVQLFSPQVLSLIKLGEDSGRLVDNLRVVATQQQKDRVFRSKILSALLYPGFVLVLAGVVGGWVLLFLLPQLANTFGSLNMELPLMTTVLLVVGKFVQQYWSIVVPVGGVLLFFGFFIFFVLPQSKFIGEFLLLKIPGIGRLLKESEIGRTGYLLGTLLGAGLTLVDSLSSMSNAANLRGYKKMYSFLSQRLEEGLTFQQGFDEYKKARRLLPIPMQQLIVAAEQSGHLPEAFLSIGELYEARTELTAKNLAVILEPILLVLVGVGVLFLALAVIMPIYGLVGGMG
ncbi:MAG: type II secretion system F family protein [Candidatus Uhrbacteria bacterium]